MQDDDNEEEEVVDVMDRAALPLSISAIVEPMEVGGEEMVEKEFILEEFMLEEEAEDEEGLE